MDEKTFEPRRPLAGLLRRQIARLESRIRADRELLWHPRLELAVAREITSSRRRLAALERMHRGAARR